MGMLSEGNITRVINTLRDPDNRNYMVAVGMIAAAALCALGYRCIRICTRHTGNMNRSSLFLLVKFSLSLCAITSLTL